MLLQLLQPCIISPPAVYLVRLTAEQLLESDPQRARHLTYGLFRIFTRRVLHSSATSRRGAAAYGDDNTFLLGAKTLERAPLRVSCLVATTFFTQLFAYVMMAPMPHAASLVLRMNAHTISLVILLDARYVGYTARRPPRDALKDEGVEMTPEAHAVLHDVLQGIFAR